MLMWVLAVLVVGLIWLAGMFVPVALWIKIVATVAVVLVCVGILVYRRWRAGAAARALEQELMRQAEKQVASARPDRRAEILEVQARMKTGIEALKRSKLGGAGNALYALPWYMIVGPPGAGKTTAIRHSGLEFPIENGGGAVRGVGGTRNCDWWFTNEAILLDTAGRYATQEDDREEWLGFLDTLRKFRAQKPINGVIVALSLGDIANATEEQVDSMAKTLRARIDELMTRLQMVVPVYVTFTKTDLVGGFVELFENLKKSERAQIFGATLPITQAVANEPAKAFEAEFELMINQLHSLALRRVQTQRQTEARARMLQFPVELEGMKSQLTELIGTLFASNRFQDTPLFRGFYFTSGTQEGRPLDKMMAGMARAFGLRLAAGPEVSPPVDPKSYFLTDLFKKVMFPDQNVAGRTKSETRRQLLVRLAIALLATVFAVLLVLPAIFSYRNNKELVVSSAKLADQAAKADFTKPQSFDANVSQLDPLSARLHELEDWDANGKPFGYGWGMYAGRTIYEPLRHEYVVILQSGFAMPTRKLLEQRLQSIEPSEGQLTDSFNRNYDTLKAYLMLTEIEHLDVDWAAPRLTKAWIDTLNGAPVENEAAARAHVRSYLLLVKSGEVPPLSRDERLVSYARSELLRVPRVARMYENLIRDANSEIAAIRRETIFYGPIGAYVTSKRGLRVDGAYTKLGWAKVRSLLDSARSRLVAEGWVLGSNEQTSEAETAKQVAQLRQVYFERYRDTWHDFIGDLDVTQPPNSERSLDELLTLTEPEWPYLRLIRILNDNVTLELSDAEAGVTEKTLLDRAADEAARRLQKKYNVDAGIGGDDAPPPRPISPVEKAFRPLTMFGMPPAGTKPDEIARTGLSEYQGLLKKLIGVLTDQRDAKTRPDPKVMTEEFQGAFRSASALLADQDSFTRPLLTPLLLKPITMTWASVVKDAGGAAGGLWEIDVWKPWTAKLEGNYPFKEGAPKDVTIEDFSDFFRPKTGLLWAFFENNLKGTLEPEGDVFVPVRRFKATSAYNGPFLTCLKDAKEITAATFNGSVDGKSPLVPFDVNLHSVSPDVAEVTIEIDGVAHTYKNTPEEWLTATWPNPKAKARGAKIQIRGISGLEEDITRQGDFGLFRLLSAADVRPGTAGGKPGGVPTLVATWTLRSQPGSSVKMDFKPKSSEHPFTKTFFSELRCPRIITSGDR